MKIRLKLIILITIVILFVPFAESIQAEEKTSIEVAQDEAVKIEASESKKLTKEEMRQRLTGIFQGYDDIREAIPGMKARKSKDGIYYEYYGTPIEKLDKNTLSGLLRAARRELTIINHQRLQHQLAIQRQIEEVNRIQRLQRQSDILCVPQVPRSPPPPAPKTYTPPQVPKVPRQ